jgi:hypothetical protein
MGGRAPCIRGHAAAGCGVPANHSFARRLAWSSTPVFEYLEIFHNRQHRPSSLGMRTPVEYETLYGTANPAA